MEKNKQQLKWGKYRRKSSEADDRQTASLDSQDRELDEVADLASEIDVERSIDDAHPAAVDQALDLVMGEGPADVGIRPIRRRE